MKIMHKEAVDRRVLVAEREVLGKVCGIDSRFLVRLQYAFQSPDKVFLVMEYSSGGSLVEFSRQFPRRRLPKESSRRLAAQLASGLRDLHGHRIIHRDLKPENVLLHDDGFVKIADFGLSTLCPTTVQRGGPATRKAGFAGTVEYAAPERLQKAGAVTTAAVDWWAFGAILFEGLCGRTPFGAPTARDLFINVLFRDPAFLGDFDDDPFAKDLLEGLLLKDANARLTPWTDRAFEQFAEHAFFTDFAKAAATPLGPKVEPPPPPPRDSPRRESNESVDDFTKAYFKADDAGPTTTSSVAIAGFEFAACVSADDEDEPLIVGTIDGEEVREVQVAQTRRPSDGSVTNKAYLFCCSALDGSKHRRANFKPVGYDDALDNRAPTYSVDSAGSTSSLLPDLEHAFNFSSCDVGAAGDVGAKAPDDDAGRAAAADDDDDDDARPGALSALFPTDIKDMLFFVCYSDEGPPPPTRAPASDDAPPPPGDVGVRDAVP